MKLSIKGAKYKEGTHFLPTSELASSITVTPYTSERPKVRDSADAVASSRPPPLVSEFKWVYYMIHSSCLAKWNLPASPPTSTHTAASASDLRFQSREIHRHHSNGTNEKKRERTSFIILTSPRLHPRRRLLLLLELRRRPPLLDELLLVQRPLRRTYQ